MNAKVKSEYDKAKTIIMHTPGEEIFFGTLQGTAALFESKPIDRYKVTEEHNNYVNTLKKQGIEVKLITDILLDGTIDEKGAKKTGSELDKLVEFALKSVKYYYPIELNIDELKSLKNYKQKTLEELHPKDLVKIILEKPEIKIKLSEEGNTNYIAESYKLNPVMNMHFLRDQQITTDKGIVIGKMNSTQRRAETEITKFAFEKLGLNIICEIKGEGRLEGGDFIPCGEFAFIGQGLRTNAEGIKQLLENQALGYDEIAVVKDYFKNQEEMHLDTYFNIAGPNKAVILEDRVNHYNEQGKFVKANPEKKTTIDLYTLTNGTYVRAEKDIPFQDYLSKKGFKVEDNSLITLTKEEQLNYGINFLTIDENKVVAVKCVSKNYLEKMNGIEVIEIPFKNFVLTSGAPHCAAQVTQRG
ncbi:MAG: hypothetical protein KKC26_04080 [Nanoarchaeota archaeon]|nr:hypothetical protein [Nanoarchaeota archaeon]